jgi:hypothetical protein
MVHARQAGRPEQGSLVEIIVGLDGVPEIQGQPVFEHV